MGLQSAVVLRVSWWATVWRQSMMWGVTVGMLSTGVRVLWSTPMMMSIVSMMWPGTAFVGFVVTVAVVSMGMGLWPWSAVSVPVLETVARSQSGAVPGMGFWSVMVCRYTWGWYLMWTVHYYMSIFSTLEATYIWAKSFYMAWFLTLETAIFFMGHDIHCWWWYQSCC